MSRQKKRPYTLVIDFETANVSPTSACSLGLVVIEDEAIIHTERFLIRTPTPVFMFTHIHGLTWKDVENAPTFDLIWPKLQPWFEKGSLLVAHNVGFDQRVLNHTAAHYQISVPKMKTECTVKMSRFKLGIQPANLKNVSDTLGIQLNHHEALSDAMASAYIYLHVTTGKKPWLIPSAIQADPWSSVAGIIDTVPSIEDFFETPVVAQKTSVLPAMLAQSSQLSLNLETSLQLNSIKSKAFLTELLSKKRKK
jgi:DNA polymerase-3 subunit epsilon